jgi:hypothetical protein
VFLSFNAVLLSSAEAGELPLVAVDRVGSRKGRGESHAANLALAHRCCVDAGQVRTAKPQCSVLARWRHSTGEATLQVGRQRLVALLREASSRCCCAREKKQVPQQAEALVLCLNAAAWGRARRVARVRPGCVQHWEGNTALRWRLAALQQPLQGSDSGQ